MEATKTEKKQQYTIGQTTMIEKFVDERIDVDASMVDFPYDLDTLR